MAETSKIEWTDSTFNPWEGCQKVGPGCDHCYAENRNARFGGGQAPNWGPGAPRRRTSAANWKQPLLWEREHEAFMLAHGRRRRVFCASLADVFDNEAPASWRAELFALISLTPHLDWLLLTKRIGNVPSMLEQPGMQKEGLPANVWLGATVVNQAEANRDIPKLLAVPARVRFLSIEPMLGAIELDRWLTIHKHWKSVDSLPVAPWHPPYPKHWYERQKLVAAGWAPALQWVICGGESGPGARPMHPDWARSLRDQCAAASVPFLFKQWGEWVPYEHSEQPPFLFSQHGHEIDGHALPDFESDDGKAQREWQCDWADQILARRVGKKAAGRLLDGATHDGLPS